MESPFVQDLLANHLQILQDLIQSIGEIYCVIIAASVVIVLLLGFSFLINKYMNKNP
jgi:hypothetical protein